MKLKAIVLTICLFTLVGCGGGISTNSLKHDISEGIVVGKITVNLNGNEVTPKSTLYFNEMKWGTYTLKLKESGYFIVKLPTGINNIKSIQYQKSVSKKWITYIFHNIEHTFNVDGNHITYIGDLNVNWNGPEEGRVSPGIGAAISDQFNSIGTVKITTSDNMPSAKEFIENKFPGENFSLTKSLVSKGRSNSK